MAEVVNKPKKRGLSLESNRHKNDSLSQREKSSGSFVDQDIQPQSLQNIQRIETDRVRTVIPTMTFTYLNPISSSVKLNQVIKYEQQCSGRRNQSLPRHGWIQQQHVTQHVPQPFCHAVNHHVCQPQPESMLSQRKPIDTDMTKIQKEELQRTYRQNLEEKDRMLRELENSNKLQQSRIEFLHSQLRAAEEKLRVKNDEITRIKNDHSKILQQQHDEKQKLKAMVVEAQRANLSLSTHNKQNKGERRRLDVGKMNQIEAKLNRLISDIKK